jgi:hypothetical protein
MARSRPKTQGVTDVANDSTDVFAEQIAAQAEPRETLQEAMAATQHDGSGNAEQAAAATAIPADFAEPSAREHGPLHLANPSGVRRESHAASVGKRQPALPDKITIPAGDMKVQLIDKGDNAAGIGIRIMFPEGSKDRPTPEEKEIIRRNIKGEDGEKTGFTWNGQMGMWHKDIFRNGEHPDDVPLTRPVAIRLDAERRVEKLAAALKHHQADPAGYADRLRQEREQATQRDGIPD